MSTTTTTTTTTVPGTVLPKSEEQDEKYAEEQVTRTVNKDGKVVLKRHGTFADIEVEDEYNDPEHSALRPPTNVWSDMPNVTIEYRDIAYKIPVLAKENKIKTIYTALRDSFDVFRKPAMKEVRALAPCSGVIKPGTMTLILAPPGHGKSSFLKAIAGKLDGDKNFSGVVKYNGVTRDEALAQGVYTNRLAGFVEQVDIHLALLTVKETFRFALDNSVPDPKLLPDGGASWDSDKRVDEMIKLLGLGECQDVVVGNDLVRGISGGQKKRVTLGEMIIGNSRVLCLDEISTGLDAAATLDICTALRKWTHETNGSIVMSLLQPAPEVVELFDNLILLREGAVIYDGPRAQVLEHFKRIGVRCPDNEDHADFLVSFLTDPEVTYERQIKLELQLKHKRHLSSDEVKAKWVEPKIPLNTPSLFNYFRSSRIFKDKEAELNELAQPNKNAGFDVSKMSAYTKAQYASAYPHSFWKHTALNLGRQAKYMRRNLSFIIPRYVQAVFMALVIGSLFSGLSADSFRDRLGLIIFFCANQGFSNFSEMPMAVEQKSVTFKQIGAGFYPALSFVLSVVSLHLPMATVEVSIFGVIVYWMTNFADDVGRFFFFLLIALCVNLAISVVFRFVVYLTSNQDVAQSISGPFVALSMLFAGFLITRDKIPKFLIWVYYLSPFSWALRSVAQNEYSHERYDALANAGNGQVDRLGNLYLSAFEIQTDLDYMWAGVGMLLGYFILFIILGALALTYKRVIFVIGTKRSTEEEELSLESQDPMIFSPSAPNDRKTPATPDIEGTPNYPARKVPGLELAAYSPNAAAYSPNATPASVNGRKVPDQVIDVSSLAHDKFALPFTPATLSWLDLGYTIFEGKEKKPKALLTGISGFARPGGLTALMGSSGAGKTTLMDVLAQRKTVGKIDGQILVNGRAVDPITFNRLIGYVEQNDLHVGTSTVREALLFSARLRLPPSVSEAQRNSWVEEVLRLLELDDIANRIIGDAVIPGLSPGQLKRLTIGVELVANPTILFLDEPTSGLDSRVALQVMRVIRRIASTGRSVVCTIHQPSSELFFMFDRLLLLRSGGHTVYFGDVGEHGSTLTNYFENTLGDKSPKCPEWANPAAWMLDVIGAGTAGSSYDVDFAEVYNKSELQKKNAVDIENASKPEKELVSEVDGLYAQPFLHQLKEVVVRQFQSYWRNIGFTYVRGMTMLFLGVVFGLLYLQISQGDYAGVNSTLAIFFMATGFSAVLNAATAMPVLFRTRAVFYREQSSHTYSPWAYAIANLATEVVYIWIYTLLFVVPCYFLVGLSSDASAFFKYVFVQYLMGLCFNILGQAMSAGMPNQVVAEIIQGVEFSFIFLFGGTFMAAGAIPAGWKWFYIINPLPKCVAAQAISQFSCTSDGSRVLAGSLCPQIDVITGSGGTVSEFTQNYVSDFIDAPFDAYWSNTGYLFLTVVVVEIIAMLCYRYVRHIKR